MTTSVIVPTYNRAETLAVALDSFLAQDLPPTNYEILVIDNGSTDRTRAVTEAAVGNNPDHHVRYVCEPEPGLLSGRHRGALEARGELLVFVDDDIEADVRWLQAITDTFQASDAQLVGGRSLPLYESTPPAWLSGFWGSTPYGGRACSFLSLLDLGEKSIKISALYVWGLNLAIRRRALFELGGFHPDCIPEHLQPFQGDGETGLALKADERGYTTVYQPRALVYHRIPGARLTVTYFEKRAFYQGVCDSYSEIRRQGGVQPSVSRESVVMLARRVFVHVYHQGSTAARAVQRLWPGSDAQADLGMEHTRFMQVKNRVRRAYIAGYDFHRDAVRQSPDLLKWVLKPDYWDYSLPAFQPESQALGRKGE